MCFGLLTRDYSLAIPLTVCGIISSIITSLINKRSAKELQRCIVEMSFNRVSDIQEFSGNKEYHHIYTMVKDFAHKYRSLEEHLKDSVSEMNHSYQEVSTLSEKGYGDITKIFQTIDEIAMPVSKQAEELQTSSEKVNNLSSYLDSINDNYRSILEEAEKINDLSESGLNSVNSMQNKFQTTLEVSNKTFEIIDNFSTTLKNIDNLATIISTISERTNLLALNASIEAARAGNMGRGFSVVANEFKKLSSQSHQYATDIRGLIDEVDEKYRIIIECITQFKEVIDQQSGSVKETNDAFKKIAAEIGTISGKIQEVNVSLNKIQSDKNEVLDLITDTAALAEQTASTTDNFAMIIAYHVQTMTDIFSYIKKFGQLISGYNDFFDQKGPQGTN